MTTAVEIQQTLWLDTPKGQMRAKFLFDSGDDADLMWVCVNDRGEFWCFTNPEVRMAKNITMGVRVDEKPKEG